MDDVIYRQDVLDALDITPLEVHDYELAVGVIKDIPSAQQWVPCSERFPEDGTYLCWEWQGFCYVDSFKDGNWETAEKCYTKCIAWMPLPEPYKEETDG